MHICTHKVNNRAVLNQTAGKCKEGGSSCPNMKILSYRIVWLHKTSTYIGPLAKNSHLKGVLIKT